jgi:hypothetical protein
MNLAGDAESAVVSAHDFFDLWERLCLSAIRGSSVLLEGRTGAGSYLGGRPCVSGPAGS